MSKFFSAMMLAGVLAFGTAAYADGAACSSEKMADAGSSCAKACAEKEGADMAKGGAAEDNTVKGYEIGQKVPDFTLPDASGKEHKLSDFAGKPVVLVFYNQNCPYVVEVKDRLSDFSKAYAEKGVTTLAIDAGVDKSKEDIAAYAPSVSHPILVNQESDLAVKFGATKTPEVFVLNQQGVIVYTGAFDNGQRGSVDGRKSYAEDAVKAVLEGKDVEVTQTKAFGCSIKFNKNAKTAQAGEKKEETKS